MSIFWRNKSVSVTGGGGFLGSFIVEQLRELGAKVSVPRSSDFDLRHPRDVELFYSNYHPEIVIHAAALTGGIGANRSRPADFFFDNMAMGLHLIHWATKFNVDKFVTIGSVCEYPKFSSVPFREHDLWNGYPEETNAPYGIAKKALLVQGKAYQKQYGLTCIHLLLANLYGPRDNFDLETSHTIPALIQRCDLAKSNNDPFVTAWGDGSPTREFLHVCDAASGIISAAERYAGVEPINLGTGQEVSIKKLAETVKQVVGYSGDIKWDTSKPNGQPRRKLDVSKAHELFGWKANIPFLAGLQDTYAYFLKTVKSHRGRRMTPESEGEK